MAPSSEAPSTDVEIPTESPDSEDTETTELAEDPRNIPVLEDNGSVVCYLVDLNLFSGSADIFRTNVGGYFFNTINTSGNVVLSFSSFYRDIEGGYADDYRPLNQYIESLRSYASTDSVTIEEESSSKILPYHKFVVAVDGKPDQIYSDKFWQTLWTGGEFNDVEYPTIFNNNAVFDDFFSVYTTPYSAMAKEYLANPYAITSYMEIGYDYNKHLQHYQGYGASYPERQLPNVHLNTWAYFYAGGHEDESSAEAAPEFPSMVYNFVSRDGQVEDLQGSLAAADFYVDEDNPEGFYTGATREEFLSFLNDDLPNFAIDDATRGWANNKFQNIFFNDGYFSTVYPEVQVHGTHYPYYTKISCPTETQGFIGRIIADAEFSSRMLRMLKEIFGNETGVPVRPTQFEKNKRYLTSSVGSDANIAISETSSTQLKGVDLFDLLLYSYKSIRSKKNNFLIIDEPNIEYASTYDKRGAYRHLNTSNTLEVMNSIVEEVKSENGITNLRSLLNVQRNSPDEDATAPNTPETKYSEVIAYRIEKSAFRNVGGQRAMKPIQNFWFFNSADLHELEFFDSQVKYDRRYRYRAYQYRVIEGLKYKYSDLQLSRVVGMPNSELSAMEEPRDEDDPDYVPEFYCIEYYDPYTDDTVNDLLEQGAYSYSGDPASSVASPAVRIATSRDPGDSKRPYFANFVVTTQPNLKIYEIPFMRKSLRVLDHPPNKLNIHPGYTIESSKNTLIFELYYEGFDPQPFPTLVSEADAILKNQYLHSNNLLENGILQKESVSRQLAVEVYRLDKKPRSFKDFEGNFRERVELRMDVSENTYTGTCVYDTIPSNQKFYYAFRVVNENDEPGHMHEIIEAEYVNDGGYKYAIFNTLFEEDLSEDVFNNITIDAQKLLQIVPNPQQSVLNTDDTSFENTAEAELVDGKVRVGIADDLIWGKTFKIRLTSKKTGKKIDLNVTYNQNNDILGSE